MLDYWNPLFIGGQTSGLIAPTGAAPTLPTAMYKAGIVQSCL